MARVPEEELARLKREVRVERLAEARGVKLSRQGANLVGLCPFHDDREPSLVISPQKNLWHCLGACGSGGSVIDWVMKSDGVGFREAVERLQQIAGGVPAGPPPAAASASPAPSTSSPAEASASPAARPLRLEPWMDDRQLWDATVGYYRETLGRRSAPRAYLERRGLASRALLEHFEVGYSDRTLGHHMPERRSKPGQRFRQRLIALGIMRETSGQEHMHGRITLPTRDESGLVVGLYGHLTDRNHSQGTPKHLYLPGPRRGVFHWQALLAHREVILCEAPFDAMTFWAAGFENVLSSWGANGFSREHLEALKRYGTKRVLLAYDRDDAGDKGAAKVAEQLLACGIECFRVLFPRGMDANQYALKVKPAAKSLGLVIRQAQWMGKGKPPATSTVLLEAAAPGGPAQADEGAAEASTSPAAAEPSPARPEAPAPEPPAEPPAATPAEAPATLGELQARAEAAEALASSLAAQVGEEPAASPAPPAPGCEVPAEVRGEEVVVWLGDRRYRVRGLSKNLSYELLKVNLLASRGDAFHVDTFDLYSARQRLGFAKQAAAELGIEEEVARHDLGRVLLKLEELQQELIERELASEPQVPAMTAEEREEALELARDPHLVERIVEDFGRCGVVGEETNKLVAYLAAVSRQLERPLGVMIQSSSAAGKSALMEAVLGFVPEEERVKYSAMTGQSLFYMSEQSLEHKVLAVVEEEGAERASYALKLLQSEGELTIASTGKDPQTGRLVTHEYRVEGPVALLLTTTAVEIDEELQNRCIVLTVDEGREQTRAIHALQREEETLEGYWARQDRREILRRHRNFQRLLRPLVVINPRAHELTFQDSQTRTRRDHKKYLALIRTIALLHQHQRTVRLDSRDGREVEVLEVQPSDVALANRLAHEVLGRSLDELPPQTRRLLERLHARVQAESERLGIEQNALYFLLREARAWTGFGQTQLKVHMARLIDLEYVVVHRGGRGQSFLFELVYAGEGADGARFVPGLSARAARSRGHRSGPNRGWSGHGAGRSGSNRPRIGPESGGGRGGDPGSKSSDSKDLPESNGKDPEKPRLGGREKNATHDRHGGHDRHAPEAWAAAPAHPAKGG